MPAKMQAFRRFGHRIVYSGCKACTSAGTNFRPTIRLEKDALLHFSPAVRREEQPANSHQ
jgi:hypothetical protein